jgi:hypothetical protein
MRNVVRVGLRLVEDAMAILTARSGVVYGIAGQIARVRPRSALHAFDNCSGDKHSQRMAYRTGAEGIARRFLISPHCAME